MNSSTQSNTVDICLVPHIYSGMIGPQVSLTGGQCFEASSLGFSPNSGLLGFSSIWPAYLVSCKSVAIVVKVVIVVKMWQMAAYEVLR